MTAIEINSNPRRRSALSHDERSALMMLVPAAAVLVGVQVFPILYALWTSLFDLRLTRPLRVPFVGLDNYVQVLSDPAFWEAALRTAMFASVSVAAIIAIALVAAMVLNENFKGRRALSAILLIPWAVPYIANGLIWKWIYDSNYGALNGLLYQLGFLDRYTVWLGDADRSLILVANAFIWKEFPLAVILLIVNLKAIPSDLYSAAAVDGAGPWQRFMHVTLPSLRPGFMLVAIYEVMIAIRHFDLFFILTEGGPGDATSVVAWRLYVETFRNLSFGTGSAMAYILAMTTLVLAYSIIRRLGRNV